MIIKSVFDLAARGARLPDGRGVQGAPVSLKRIGLNRLALCRPMGIVWAGPHTEPAECSHQRPNRGSRGLPRHGESSAVGRSGGFRSARRSGRREISATAPFRLDATRRFEMRRLEPLNGHDESQTHWRPFGFGRISVMRMCPIAQSGHSVRDLPVSVS